MKKGIFILGLLILWRPIFQLSFAQQLLDEKEMILEQIVDNAVPSGPELLLWLFMVFCLLLVLIILLPALLSVSGLIKTSHERTVSETGNPAD